MISTDGAYVPLVKGERAEVRTVAIGEAKAQVTAQGECEVHTCHLSYFSRMTDAITFGGLAEGEMRRRGVSQAKTVCAVTDGADKVLVQTRLKGAGMHWAPAHVNPMLALRTAICNKRWDEAWRDILQEQRFLLYAQRQQKATVRFQSLISSLMLLLLQCRSSNPKLPSPPSSLPALPAATLPGSSHPSARHPWKRGPACRPKLSAKKLRRQT